ncbi:hypothetical protein RhiirC2_785864 [Rhizophagus irregularis]|uniref:F-box domain-containing protein n=1 Tax=Rhizophagus irregularis TaxID=588596 RepID=A0A2N1MVI9_9GLOM|nr:hypothetical protein RhiirC2_785864 [Rhizophagus irregularis]
MSCSKIFLGDLPELVYGIIKNFQNDYSTLHSCVLVNRLWCRLAIPLLWENPFSTPTGNYNFIEVYLYNLNDCLKTKINDYQIINHLLPSNTLFNYPSFIRYLDIFKIIHYIEMWLETNDKTSNLVFQSVYEFKELISMSLIKLFIDNEINLHTLKITISTNFIVYINNILEIILKNPNLINNIKNLEFSILTSNKLIEYRISQIINSHQNLKRILLGHDSLSLYQSLLLSKSNCSNTLSTIIFYYVNFNDRINNLVKVIENLNVLESVHIIYCFSLDSFTQQIINLSKPFKLKSLFITGNFQIDLLQSLLQKYGNYLENFGYGIIYLEDIWYEFDRSLTQQSLELTIKYCRNIKFLDLYRIGSQITSQVFGLIENIKQNLNHLSINVGNGNNKLILQNLGQILPSKLEYLSLVLHIKTSDFEVFLKNSQNTLVEKLVINNMGEGLINILPYIKEHIMKKKRVKYLAIKTTLSIIDFNRNDEDLFDSKEQVKEFKLHNIKVLKYANLSTGIYRFVNEID